MSSRVMVHFVSFAVATPTPKAMLKNKAITTFCSNTLNSKRTCIHCCHQRTFRCIQFEMRCSW